MAISEEWEQVSSRGRVPTPTLTPDPETTPNPSHPYPLSHPSRRPGGLPLTLATPTPTPTIAPVTAPRREGRQAITMCGPAPHRPAKVSTHLVASSVSRVVRRTPG